MSIDENTSEMVVCLNVECTCTHAAPAPSCSAYGPDNTTTTGRVTECIRGEVCFLGNVVHSLVRID